MGEGVRGVVGLYPQVHTSNLQVHLACAYQLIVGMGGDGDRRGAGGVDHPDVVVSSSSIRARMRRYSSSWSCSCS